MQRRPAKVYTTIVKSIARSHTFTIADMLTLGHVEPYDEMADRRRYRYEDR
jgi:hypothetical protein